MALMEDGETAEEKPAICTCTEKCVAGAVNTACPVCAINMATVRVRSRNRRPRETEPEEPKQKPAGLNPAILLVVLAVMGGVGAFVYFKFIKQKPKTKGSDNLDDYDYGEDDTEQEDEDPWRPRNLTSRRTPAGAAMRKARTRPNDPVHRQPL